MRRLGLQSKLILTLMLVGMAAMLTISYASYRTARAAARDAAQRQLLGVRITKTTLLQNLLAGFRDQLTGFSTSRTALESLTAFRAGLAQLDSMPVDEASVKRLEAFYRDSFIPALSRSAAMYGEVPRLLPGTRGARAVQALYVAGNPNPYMRGAPLTDAGDGSAYTEAHKRFHTIFTQVAFRAGIDDMLLVDATGLRVLYTLQKTTELGTSLADGPYANSSLAAAVRAALQAGDRAVVTVADFDLYRPSLGQPHGFLCAPIFDGAVPTGVAVFQIPMERIMTLMSANRQWEREGLGKTGEVYVVGQDRLMRSRSRFMIQDSTKAIASLAFAEVPTAVLEQIRRQKSEVMALPVRNESTRLALSGESGVHEIRDYRNELVLSAYGPLDFANLRWAVLAEMDAAEAYGPVADLGRKTLATAAGMAILISLVALLAASAITRPIRALTAAARKVSAGDLDVAVQLESEDEIRELADAFNLMTRSLKEKTTALEETLRRNEELLLNVLPSHAASRLRDGLEPSTQTFADVSILHASIVGLDAAPGGETQALEWLNALVVAFDEAAERFSVEKLKSQGPNYIAVCGLSMPRPDHHQRIIDFAEEMLRIVNLYGAEQGVTLEVDVGVNCGPVTGGVIGRKRFIYDLWGETMNLSRMLQEDGVSTIQVTEAMATRLQGQYVFERRPDLPRKDGPPIVVYRLLPGAVAVHTPVGA